MKKIIFIDIDGTIRDFDGYIPASAKEAIQTARSNGHKVCICTGRPYCHIEPRVLEIGFDGVIAGSGSYALYEGSCVRHKYITQFTYIALCEYLLTNRCAIELHTYKESYLPRQVLPEYEKIGQEFQEKMGSDAKKFTMPPVIIDSLLDVQKIEKILYFSNDLSNEQIKEKWGTSFYIVPTSIPCNRKYAGEITPSIVNKAEGMKSIMEAGGFQREDVIALGDSDNDIEMLQLAGLGIAMGNGNQAAKEAADYVTGALREDGLYQAFQKEGLI